MKVECFLYLCGIVDQHERVLIASMDSLNSLTVFQRQKHLIPVLELFHVQSKLSTSSVSNYKQLVFGREYHEMIEANRDIQEVLTF